MSCFSKSTPEGMSWELVTQAAQQPSSDMYRRSTDSTDAVLSDELSLPQASETCEGIKDVTRVRAQTTEIKLRITLIFFVLMVIIFPPFKKGTE